MAIQLQKAADLLQVHPRTVLRALTGEANPYLSEDEPQEIDEDKLCEVFGIKPKLWRQVRAGKDAFVTREWIMKQHDIHRSTFKRRKYPVAAACNRTRRYSEVQVQRYKLENYPSEDEDQIRQRVRSADDVERELKDIL